MAGRTIAIGDIHGCSAALATLLAAIKPEPTDLLVILGDFVDRGPDSRGTIEQLLALFGQCNLRVLLGNHEEMMLTARSDPSQFEPWLFFGGEATLASYGARNLENLPGEHLKFIESCRPFLETDTHLFVHANYIPTLPLSGQPATVLRWESLGDRIPEPHSSGKTAIVGHTPQRLGTMLDMGYLKCLDTFCYGGGWLSALDVHGGQVWQTNQQAALRGTISTA